MNYILVRNLLLLLFLVLTCYCYYEFYSHSQLVYIYKKDLDIRDTTLGSRRGLGFRDIYFTKVYDAESEILYRENVIPELYVWSKLLSIQRLFFLDKKAINRAAEDGKIYSYLYLGNEMISLKNLSFGLSANHPPSGLKLHSDIFRYSTKISLFVFFILFCLIYWCERKFPGTNIWDVDLFLGKIPETWGAALFLLIAYL